MVKLVLFYYHSPTGTLQKPVINVENFQYTVLLILRQRWANLVIMEWTTNEYIMVFT